MRGHRAAAPGLCYVCGMKVGKKTMTFTAVLKRSKDGDGFSGLCPESMSYVHGSNVKKTMKNLREAVATEFEGRPLDKVPPKAAVQDLEVLLTVIVANDDPDALPDDADDV
ncbi:MAG: hypothetical protein OD918_01075 [Gammaproteobacteria bacterium]